MLEEIGVVSVDEEKVIARDLGRTKGVYKDSDDIVYTPSLAKQKDKKGVLRYLSTVVTIYNPQERKYTSFSMHKLLYAWTYGVVPEGVEIDHYNTNPLDNRVENLRPVDRTTNGKNRRKWKMFTEEEIEGKSLEEVREMIAQRIEEYKDNPYYEQVKREKKELKRKEREEWLSHAEERKELQLKRTRITTLKRQIKRLENEILHYRTKDEFHSEYWLEKKVKELSGDIVEKRAELIDLESSICWIKVSANKQKGCVLACKI